MGLLDYLSSDPNQQQALMQGLLSGAFGAMAGRGSRLQALGQGGLAGLQGYAGAQEMQQQQRKQSLMERMQQMQLQQLQDAQAQQAKQRTFLENMPSPQMQASQVALAGGGGPTAANAQKMPAVDPFQQQLFEAARAGVVPFGNYVQTLQKDNSPLSVKSDETLLDRKTLKPVFAGTPKLPSDLQEYEYAKNQGYRGSYNDFRLEKAKAGASNVNVKVDNALGGGIAKEVGPLVAAGFQQATGAAQQIQTADNIVKAIDSNKVLAGPGATFKLRGLQLGQVLGASGRDAAETIANTRAAIQGLAQSTVAARSALKGQGQVSDFEGRLLEKAASGNIDDMTAPEVKQIAILNKKLSQQIIEQHKNMLGKVKSHKDPVIAGLADFFDVNAPTQVVDWNNLGR